MCPVGSGNRSHAVTDAGAILADNHTVPTGNPRVAIGHVGGTLLVNHRHQTNAGGCEDIHGVHESGTHDAKHVGDTV
jgi:hypothetical protein